MTDATQAVVAEYAYDAFGNTTKTAGSMDSDFQYAGMQVLSPFPNLDWTHHRIYQTGMGRWLSRDPLGGNSPNPRDGAEILQGSNLYAYVGNTPTRWIDPLGLGWGFYFGIGFSGTSVGHGSGSGRSGMIGLNTYGQLWTSDSQTFFNDVDGGFWGFGLAITAGFQSTPNCPDSTSDGKASEAGLALGLGGEGGSASMDDSSLGLGHGYGPAVGLGLYQAQGPTVTHTGSTPPLWGGFQ